jgi:predicted nucleic acid-binding protein
VLLIDSNILAYLLIDGVHTEGVRRLAQRDSAWQSESYILIEFTNVLTRYMAADILGLTEVQKLFSEADQIIGTSLHTASHLDALALAAEFKVSAYDARYLAVAQTLGQKLVTEDKKLRAAAPKLTQSVEEALALS